MSTAILVATARATAADTPAALLHVGGGTILGRFAAQTVQAGCEEIVVITRPEWAMACDQALQASGLRGAVREASGPGDVFRVIAEVASAGGGDTLIAQAETLTHDACVVGLMKDPRVATGVLCARIGGDHDGYALRLDRGRVVSAASAYHHTGAPTHRFLGLLKVGPGDRDTLARTARDLAERLTEPPSLWAEELERKLEDAREDVEHHAEVARADVVPLLVVGMVRADVVLRSFEIRELFRARPFTQEAAEAARERLASIDEDAVLLRSAVKADDGFFTTFFVSPYSRYVARWCARRGLSPNQVTVFSVLLGVAAAVWFAAGTRLGLIVGAVLLQSAFTFDCVDGQLARYTLNFSGLGAWLDSVFDRTKEYVVFAGLAFGATRAPGANDTEIWTLAGAALALQVVRHLLDFSFAATQHGLQSAARTMPLEIPSDVLARAASDAPVVTKRLPARRLARLGVAASGKLEGANWMRFAKRTIIFPIGERFAVISLAAAFSGARTTFIILLVWGVIGAAYSGAGRVLRSLA